RVDRELALDREPLVVLADELVEVVEAPGPRDRPPARRERHAIAAVLPAQFVVRALQAPRLVLDPRLDLPEALHPARPHAGLQVRLHAAPGLARAPRERAPDPVDLLEVPRQQPLDRGAG